MNQFLIKKISISFNSLLISYQVFKCIGAIFAAIDISSLFDRRLLFEKCHCQKYSLHVKDSTFFTKYKMPAKENNDMTFGTFHSHYLN